MQRKGYTIGERKSIVDYIKQKNSYHEIKGRKLWMDLERSALTCRTWQSLKETFLKRILPDIHNPYYKLTQDEIASFRVGYSMIRNKNNNLQIGIVSGSPDKKNIENAKNGVKMLNNDANNSDSAETVVAPFYTDANEIKKALLSSSDESDAEIAKPRTMRDRITYAEPLSPICQIILKDFETDNSEEGMVKTNKTKGESNDTTKMNGDTGNDIPATTKRLSLRNAPNQKDTSHESSSSEHSEVVKQRKDKEPRTPRKRRLSPNKKISTGNSTNLKEKNQQEANIDSHNHSPDSVEIPNNQEALRDLDSNNTKQNTTKKRKTSSGSATTENEEMKVAKRKTRSSNKPESNKLEKTSQTDVGESAMKKIVTRNNAKASTTAPVLDFTHNNNSDSMKSSEDSEPPNKKSNNIKTSTSKKSQNKESANAKPTTSKVLISNEKSNNSSNVKISASKNKTNKDLNNDKATTSNRESSNSSNSSDTKVSISKTKRLDKDLNNDKATTKNKIQNKEFKSDKSNTSKDASADGGINKNVQNVAHIEAKVISIHHRENISSDDDGDVRLLRTENLFVRKSDNQVILLNSNSESDSSETEVFQCMSKKKNRLTSRQSFSKILGLCSESGGVMSNHQRKYSNNSPISHVSRKHESTSSSWEVESDSDFQQTPDVANKYAHFQKPHVGRIMPKNNDGTLLLAFKNRAYPIISDGNCKTHLKYTLRGDTYKDYVNHWKQKYLREKKRTAALTELLRNKEAEHQKISEQRHEEDGDQIIDITNDKSPQNKALIDLQSSELANTVKLQKDKDSLKFTFTKDDYVTSLEGNWKVIQPILRDILVALHVTNQPVEDAAVKETAPVPQIIVTEPTPVKPVAKIDSDEAPKRDINEIEENIFNEIAVLDKTVTERPVSEDTTNVNVTRRKGRPKGSRNKSSVKEKVNKVIDEDVVINESKLLLVENNAGQSSTFQSPRRTGRSLDNKKAKTPVLENVQEDEFKPESMSSMIDEDSNIKYRFPSPTPEEEPVAGPSGINTNKTKGENNDNSNNVKRETRSNRRSKRFCMKSDLQHHLKTHNSSSDATESMQGCPNSGCSPILRQKQRRIPSNRNARSSLRLNNTNLSDNTSISSVEGLNPKHPSNFTDAVGSKVYRTDSFEILMQNEGRHENKLSKIHKMDDLARCDNEIDLSPASQDIEPVKEIMQGTDNNNVSNTNYLDSSNVSKSASPELSIIENITIDKEMLNTIPCDYPNAEQISITSSADELQEISTIHKDPLDGELEDINKMSVDRTINTPSNKDIRTRNLITPEIQLCVNAGKVSLVEPNVSDVLNERLSNMLLDSAKRVCAGSQLPCDVPKVTKRNLRKRCSTPQIKKKRLNLDVIDERMEHCVRVKSRHSCPPSIIHSVADNSKNITQTGPGNAQTRANSKEKKKRDVIKVKILRPKDKRISVPTSPENDGSQSESGIFLYEPDDTVNLINNHADTCDSVAIIENSESIVSLDSSSLQPAECTVPGCHEQINYEEIDMDCFLGDAQDGTSMFLGPTLESAQNYESSSRPSVNSASSFITDDLTDESQKEPSNWFLFSDEENSIAKSPNGDTGSASDYMQRLFPITCAIPDLSTITEMSRDVVTNNNSNTQ